MQNHELTVRIMTERDVEAASRILAHCEMCELDEARRRLASALAGPQIYALLAECDGEPAGMLLACYNGFHIFLSHIAVLDGSRSRGVGSALLDELARHARAVDARGIITDARLSSVGFFQKHQFRLPGAVFLIQNVQASA